MDVLKNNVTTSNHNGYEQYYTHDGRGNRFSFGTMPVDEFLEYMKKPRYLSGNQWSGGDRQFWLECNSYAICYMLTDNSIDFGYGSITCTVYCYTDDADEIMELWRSLGEHFSASKYGNEHVIKGDVYYSKIPDYYIVEKYSDLRREEFYNRHRELAEKGNSDLLVKCPIEEMNVTELHLSVRNDIPVIPVNAGNIVMKIRNLMIKRK